MRGPGLVWLSLLALAGCAGNLEHPERFGDGGALATGSCDAPTTVFASRCASAGCHAWTSPAAQLDLQSANAAMRLRDVAALGCSGKLIDSAQPQASVLLRKLSGSTCGSTMPPGAPLAQNDLDCVAAWVASVAGGGP